MLVIEYPSNRTFSFDFTAIEIYINKTLIAFTFNRFILRLTFQICNLLFHQKGHYE